MTGSFALLFILIFPLVCSFIGYWIGTKSEKYRDIFNTIVTGINFALVTILYKQVSVQPIDISISNIMGTGLHLRLDVFRYIFLWITSLIWFLTTVYSTHYLIRYKNRNRYYFFFMLTLGSTIGIFISENFLNLFTFFEIMSLTSYALIIHDEDDYSHDAGDTYIVMAVSGGLILLMGLFLLYNYTQTLDIGELYLAVGDLGKKKYVISSLLLIGFGIKAGMVPLHVWLPKAHPAAPAPASAVLSGILLKTGIFGIILTIDIMLKGDFYASVSIIVIGFINMFMGGLLAMFQRNIKRILAYSSMSQIGYILVGIGLVGILKEHGAIAIYGTLFHIINHGIFKVLLFMGAGCIYMALHELSINKIGGFGKNIVSLKLLFLIGFLAIIGMPGFNGFASKTLIHEALYEAKHIYHSKIFIVAESIFLLSSSFTVAYLLKIFVAVFVESSDNNFDKLEHKMGKWPLIPMAILGMLIIYIGIRPYVVMNILSGALKTFGDVQLVEVHFFTIANIKSSIYTILLGCVIYVLFVRGVLKKGTGTSWYYENPSLKWFSLENHVYKPMGRLVFHFSSSLLKIIDGSLVCTVSFIASMFEILGKLEVEYEKNIIHLIRKELSLAANEVNTGVGIKHSMEKSVKKEKEKYNVKETIESLSNKMNSITFSIFVFAGILVLCLLILICAKGSLRRLV